MQIIGFSYPNRLETKNFTDVIKKIKGFNPKIPSILLYHAPTGINEAEKIGINLQLA
jgi:predicted MPP superfamily phosphohydrolase